MAEDKVYLLTQEAYNKMLAEHLRKRKYCTWKSRAGITYLGSLLT